MGAVTQAETTTGYPSIDRPWLKYYEDGADLVGLNVPEGKTVWDVFRELLLSQGDIAAIEYFGNRISRPELVKRVERWARSFRAMGVSADEVVAIYSAVFPDVCAMFFALNAIGAIPYFLKLDSSTGEIRAETAEARFAIVFDGLWESVACVFSEERFEKVIIVTAEDSMPALLKLASSIAAKISGKKPALSKHRNCISVRQALDMADKWEGDYRVPFSPGRIAAITVSSGTTGTGVKGIMDTNEGVMASVMMTAAARIRYFEGRKLLLEMPLMASTSLNCLFLLPLYRGMTLVIDPRLSKDTWHEHVMKYRPAVTICTGAYWEIFFNEVERRIRDGEGQDLSFADMFIMGGSGTTPEKLSWMNGLMSECGATTGIFSGYGLSEIFGVLSVQQNGAVREHRFAGASVIDVGIPIPGFVVSVHGEDGGELTYGNRGELWVSSPTLMHGYYGKPDLTERVVVDGVVHTGDCCSIDEDGFIYFYGRMGNSTSIGGRRVYLFDIANDVREHFDLSDCIVERKDLIDGEEELVMYLAKRGDQKDGDLELLSRIDGYLTPDLPIAGYKVFEGAIPANPATLKPKANDADGFVKLIDGELLGVAYESVGGKLKKAVSYKPRCLP